MMMKNRTRKCIAMILSLAVLLACFGLGASASGPAYSIGNPYKDVDWGWGQYKTQLHVHSNASDGSLSIAELVEEHYRLGYDILAITDHATMGAPWNQMPRMVPYMRIAQLFSSKGPHEALMDARRQQIFEGFQRGGRGMLEITGAIELGGIAESHIQGFFSDYGQGLLGVNREYDTPIREVQKRGGVTLLNHIGRVTGADGKSIAEAEALYAPGSFWGNRYSKLFVDYPGLLGMDINSKSDTETRNDRILYDTVLQTVIPHGRTPWAFSTSDGHGLGDFDRGFTVHLMPEKTPEALRESMESGAFFGVNRAARREAGDGFRGEGEPPRVNSIAVDETAGTITIAADNYTSVKWAADGEEIAAGETLRLADHDEEIGVYVRAYLLGEGGILYVQPFTVLRAGESFGPQPIPAARDYSDVLRFLYKIIEPLLMYTPLRLIVFLLTRFDPAYDLAWLWNMFG